MSQGVEYAKGLAATSALASAAYQLGEIVAEAGPRAEVAAPAIHCFGSTADAQDATDSDELVDGDVLVVPSEGIVAILKLAWPAALTAAHGELHRPVETYAAGDRFVGSDGATRTVDRTEHGRDGRLWLRTAEGSAWRADRCEKVDVSRVDEARRAARQAVATLRNPTSTAGDEAAGAISELGEALRYLAQASPGALDELSAECTRPITAELPRLDVVPSDIVHMLGVRLHVLDTGVQHAAGEKPRWWADVIGVDEADRRATYRAPWRTSIAVEYATWDLLTVERLSPQQPF